MIWTNRINPQLNVLWQGLWKPGSVEAPRRIYDHELVVNLQGAYHVSVAGQSFHCGPATYLILPPDVVHTTTALPGALVHRHCIHFDWDCVPRLEGLPICEFLPADLLRAGIRPAPPWVPRRIWQGRFAGLPAMRPLLKALFLRWRAGASERATCRALALEILLRVLPAGAPAAPARHPGADHAQRVRELLDERYRPGTSVQALLESTGLSYAHLCRAFHRRYGLSPVHYVNAGRIERARMLLAEGRWSIKEVSRRLGFEDPAYFSRLFRKYQGSSPRMWLRESR